MSVSIIFDLDNTLVGSYKDKDGNIYTEARPGALELLNKLRELKKNYDIKHILFIKSTYETAKTGIEALYAEDFFDDIITIDNYPSIKEGTLEDDIFGIYGAFYGLKPVTLINDRILLIEDNYQMIKAVEKAKHEYQKRGVNRELYALQVTYYESPDPNMLQLIYEIESQKNIKESEQYLIEKTKEYINRQSELSLIEMDSVYKYINTIINK